MDPQHVEKQYLVYLACAITGLSFEDATNWHEEVDRAFPSHLIAVKPLRGAEYLKGERTAKGQYAKDPLSTPKGIIMRCYNDVDRADGLLVNLLMAKEVSRGTCGEVGRAAFKKPIVVVMKRGNPHWGDPMMHEPAIVVPTLELGVRTIVRLVSPV